MSRILDLVDLMEPEARIMIRQIFNTNRNLVEEQAALVATQIFAGVGEDTPLSEKAMLAFRRAVGEILHAFAVVDVVTMGLDLSPGDSYLDIQQNVLLALARGEFETGE